MFNFAEATRLAVEAGAAIQAPDAPAAIRDAAGLLSNPGKRSAMGLAGRKLCETHRGATQRHLDACRELLREARPGIPA
jgi:3-deoxy-D-manno-octulosonic-acid transferase